MNSKGDPHLASHSGPNSQSLHQKWVRTLWSRSNILCTKQQFIALRIRTCFCAPTSTQGSGTGFRKKHREEHFAALFPVTNFRKSSSKRRRGRGKKCSGEHRMINECINVSVRRGRKRRIESKRKRRARRWGGEEKRYKTERCFHPIIHPAYCAFPSSPLALVPTEDSFPFSREMLFPSASANIFLTLERWHERKLGGQQKGSSSNKKLQIEMRQGVCAA